MFSTDEFKAWAKQDTAVLFAAVMTKIDGREDDDLLRTYGFRGFPSLALLDADGEMITSAVQRNLASISSLVAAAPEYLELAKRKDAGKSVDPAAWYMARLRLGKLELEEAANGLRDLGLSPDECEFAEKEVFRLEVDDLMAKTRPARRGAEPEVSRDEAAETIYQAFRSGKRLPEGARSAAYVDNILVEAGAEHGDAEAFFFAYERVKESVKATIERYDELLPRYEADLEKFKDDDRMLPRVKGAIQRAKAAIERSKKRLDELDAQAKKLQR